MAHKVTLLPSTTNKDDVNQISNIKFAGATYLSHMSTKINRQAVRASAIPLNVLYNDTINKVKKEEKEMYRNPKPLTFTITENPKNKQKTIRFEILG